MSGTMSVQASMSIQNFGRSGNNMTNLSAQYDQLLRKRNNIENNKSMSQKEKDTQLAQIDEELNNINQQIEENQKKAEQKQQQKQLEKEKEQLSDTVDPETARVMMQMEQLMKMAVKTDSGQSSEEDASSVEDDLEEIKNLNVTKDQGEEAVDKGTSTDLGTETVASSNQAINEDAVRSIKTKSSPDTIAEKSDTSETEEVKEGVSDQDQELLNINAIKKLRKGLFIDKKI